jgi:hypothetical protein
MKATATGLLFTTGFAVSALMGPAAAGESTLRDEFAILDPASWTIIPEANWGSGQLTDGTDFAILIEPGANRPPVRRPQAQIVLKDQVWEDVTLTARFRMLYSDEHYGRDAVLIFGYQDDTHYYYAHLCDDSKGRVHNVIMRVDGKTRTVISSDDKPEPRLGNAWQTGRVVHHTDGRIEVYFEDMDTPYMVTHDTTYPAGRVGVGSFNDAAAFDWVEVSGTRVDRRP